MSETGPFFAGKDFGYVDIILVPYTFRLGLLEHYRNYQMPKNDTFKRLKKFMSAAHAHPSVVKTLPKWDDLIAMYLRYANNTAKTEVADAIRDGTAMP